MVLISMAHTLLSLAVSGPVSFSMPAFSLLLRTLRIWSTRSRACKQDDLLQHLPGCAEIPGTRGQGACSQGCDDICTAPCSLIGCAV